MNGIAAIATTTSPLHFLCSSKHTFTTPCNALKINNLSLQEIPPNALLRKHNSSWRGGFSLGVDLGMSRTGLALSKGYSIRPLKVFDEITHTFFALLCIFCVMGFLFGAYFFRFWS